VAVVGAGFQGAAIVRQIVTATPGMRVAGVANRHGEAARRALSDLGLEPAACEGRAAIEAAIASGRPVATEDAIGLAQADGVDVVVEVTGSVEYAAQVVLAAIEAGKHVVQMNAELDGTVGPILRTRADAAGVVYTFSDGDQPGVQMNLFRFVRGLGVTPVLCGNIKGLHDPYRNPETQRAFAEKWGQKPAMVASFADGTKISFEQAIVATARAFAWRAAGCSAPTSRAATPGAPWCPWRTPCRPSPRRWTGSRRPGAPGLVDYVVGARPGPGVFVLGTHDDPRQRHFLNLYKLGPGPLYCFSTPYHLCHFEVPTSVARAALFGDAVLAPLAGPVVGVVAVAKTDLQPGALVSEFGGFEAYGVAENQDVVNREDLLPLGLALGGTLRRAVPKDRALTFADVALPEGRLVDRLYAEQRQRFAIPSAA
jgi:predicted homoserine dehydrogenase-like protein